MPGFDRTGPEGKGSRTGRGLGKCNPNTQNKDDTEVADELRNGLRMRRGRGLAKRVGLGRGKGRGRGLGRGKL
jgi:hypothetical protein